MRIAIAGAGKMAAGLIHDFLHHDPPEQILLLDQSGEALAALRARYPAAPLEVVRCDLGSPVEVAAAIGGYDGLIGAATYRLNAVLAEVAIEKGLSMVDLGGNPDIVARQLALDEKARRRGVTILPDCGLAPGLVSVLAADGIRQVGEADSVRMRVGGLPVDPQPPLKYAISFSAEGLVNEYLEDAEVLRDGRPVTVPSLSELETIEFPPPYGRLEAFQTAGGSSTLPRTYAGKVRELDYKTIRYPGHCEILRTLFALGFAGPDPVETRVGKAVPKEVLITLLDRALPHDQEDVILLRVTTTGTGGERVIHEWITPFDSQTGLSAMQQCTAFPAAIAMQLILAGRRTRAGVVPQEDALDPREVLEGLARRGLPVEIRQEAPDRA